MKRDIGSDGQVRNVILVNKKLQGSPSPTLTHRSKSTMRLASTRVMPAAFEYHNQSTTLESDITQNLEPIHDANFLKLKPMLLNSDDES